MGTHPERLRLRAGVDRARKGIEAAQEQVARRRAELDAATVGTRDGVLELTAAVEALRATTARSSQVMIVLTGVLVALTIALVALTIVLVLG